MSAGAPELPDELLKIIRTLNDLVDGEVAWREAEVRRAWTDGRRLGYREGYHARAEQEAGDVARALQWREAVPDDVLGALARRGRPDLLHDHVWGEEPGEVAA